MLLLHVTVLLSVGYFLMADVPARHFNIGKVCKSFFHLHINLCSSSSSWVTAAVRGWRLSQLFRFACKIKSCWDYVQWVPELSERLEFFHVNKSCKIECCDNKTHWIIQNMILSRSLELKLNLLWRTTISGQHPSF